LEHTIATSKNTYNFHKIANFGGMGCCLLSTLDTIADCNKIAAKILGLKKTKELLNSSFSYYLSDDQKTEFSDTLRQVKKSGKSEERTYLLSNLDSINIQLSCLETTRGIQVVILFKIVSKETKPSRKVLLENLDKKDQKLKKIKKRHKQFEQRLKESQKISQTGNWELDIETQNLYWSDEVFEIFEVDKKDFKGTNEWFLELVYPDDRKKLVKAFTESLKSRKQFCITHRILTKKGVTKHLEERSQTIYDSHKKPLRSIGVVIDVSDRIKNEEQLKFYKDLLDQAQEISKIGGWTWDLLTTNFTWTNETYKIFDLVSKNVPDLTFVVKLFCRQDRKVIIKAIRALLTEGVAFDLKLRFLKSENKYTWIRTIGQPVYENNKIIRVNGIVQDIQHQILMEEQLENERQKYVQTLEQNNEPVITINSKSIIQIYNKAAERLFEYKKEEMIGQRLEKLFGHDQEVQNRHKDYIKNNVEKSYHNSFDQFMRIIKMFTKSGKAFPGQISLTKVIMENDTYYAAFIRDLSEDLKVQEELEKERIKNLKAIMIGQELERKRVASELHDGLGQTLTAAKLSLGALLQNEDYEEELKSKIRIIKQFIDLSVVESRRISLSMMPLELESHGLMVSIEKILNKLTTSLNIKTEFIKEEGFDVGSEENAKIVYRIIQEAINNAVKHGAPSRISVSFKKNKDKKIIVVSDNGKGFDYTKVIKGLGLVNMSQRASSVNGNIEFNSEKGKGTEIRITLSPVSYER